MERHLSEVERAQVEACKEPGERVTHRITRQTGIVRQKTGTATLVWWGTSDNTPRMTWELPDDLEEYDARVWPEHKEQGSPSGFLRTIDLRDPKPVKRARKVPAKKAPTPTNGKAPVKRARKAT